MDTDVEMMDVDREPSVEPFPASSLNSDVLSIVFTFLDPRHALTLATTSKDIYTIALRQGLSSVVLNLRRPSQICAFSAFMLARAAERIPLLRNLELLGSNHYVLNDTSFIVALADLLENAHRLKRLSIAHSAVLFEHEPRLRDAVCSLPNLQELGLGSISVPNLAELVERLKSSPRKLSLDDVLTDPAWHRLDEQIVDFTFLASLQHLEYLDVSSCMRFVYRISSECRNIRHITLALPLVPIPVLARAFPDLRSLCVCPHYGGRHASQIDQGVGENLPQWHHLDHLHGAAMALADWHSSCPVRWLKLDYEIISAEHDQLAALKSLRSASPLFFSFATAAYVGVSFWSRMVDVVPRLRCLELILDLGLPDFEIKMRSWLRDVLPVIKALPLYCIRLEIITRGMTVGAFTEAKRVWWATLPPLLAEHFASLCYMSIKVQNLKAFQFKVPWRFEMANHLHTWWRVRHSRPGASVEPISLEMGEQVREYLYHLDHASLRDLDH